MTVSMEVVISSPDDAVDMKTGLDTLQGISDATRKIGETVLSGHLAQRLHHTGGVRTTLKKTFKGSYGQNFSIDVHDADYQAQLRKLRQSTLIELIRYFLNEAMYEDGGALSERAENKIDSMGALAIALVQEVRTSCMPNIHEVPRKFGYTVTIRQKGAGRTVLSEFNSETSASLTAESDPVEVELIAGITRFNINTGNGRLQLKGERETQAFGFGGAYSEVKFEAKKSSPETLTIIMV